MIDLYYWTTPNGHKITIFLEETGLPYRIVPVNISKGEQFRPEFLAISPNNRMPAIVDHEPKGSGRTRFGIRVGRDPRLSRRKDRPISAERPARPRRSHGMAVLADGRARTDGGPKPSFLAICAGKDPLRDRALRQGDEPPLWRAQQTSVRSVNSSPTDYSIADMAIYPWVVPYERQGQKLEDFPHLKRWFEAMRDRAAVKRAYAEAKRSTPADGQRGIEKDSFRSDGAAALAR